jgi:hypothetical protein
MQRYAYDCSAIQQGPFDMVEAHAEAEKQARRGNRRFFVSGEGVRLLLRPMPGGYSQLREEGDYWCRSLLPMEQEGVDPACSVLGICWWTLPDGAISFRVVADHLRGPSPSQLHLAVRAWGKSISGLFDTPPEVLVWPDLAIEQPKRECAPFLRRVRKELNVRPLQPALWAMAADWCEDHELAEESARYHAALATLAILAPHL